MEVMVVVMQLDDGGGYGGHARLAAPLHCRSNEQTVLGCGNLKPHDVHSRYQMWQSLPTPLWLPYTNMPARHAFGTCHEVRQQPAMCQIPPYSHTHIQHQHY